MSLRNVTFARTPILFDCPVPVDADRATMCDGEPLPLEERRSKCGAPAAYLIGAQLVCEEHLRLTCGLLEIDPEGVIRELGGGA